MTVPNWSYRIDVPLNSDFDIHDGGVMKKALRIVFVAAVLGFAVACSVGAGGSSGNARSAFQGPLFQVPQPGRPPSKCGFSQGQMDGNRQPHEGQDIQRNFGRRCRDHYKFSGGNPGLAIILTNTAPSRPADRADSAGGQAINKIIRFTPHSDHWSITIDPDMGRHRKSHWTRCSSGATGGSSIVQCAVPAGMVRL